MMRYFWQMTRIQAEYNFQKGQIINNAANKRDQNESRPPLSSGSAFRQVSKH